MAGAEAKQRHAGKANIVVGVLVALVIVGAVIALAGMRLGAGGAASLQAIVHDGDGATYELSLAQDTVVPITTSLGTNVVEVRDGTVFVREADCANQDCIHQGSISVPGKQIICLPHKLWIEVVADGEGDGQMDVEAVAGQESAEALDAVAR